MGGYKGTAGRGAIGFGEDGIGICNITIMVIGVGRNRHVRLTRAARTFSYTRSTQIGRYHHHLHRQTPPDQSGITVRSTDGQTPKLRVNLVLPTYVLTNHLLTWSHPGVCSLSKGPS